MKFALVSATAVFAMISSAQADVYSQIQVGDKMVSTVVKTSFLAPSQMEVRVSASEISEPHGEWSGCRISTSVEVGTVSAVITVTSQSNELIERRVIEEKPLVLQGIKEDQSDEGCKKVRTDYTVTANSDWFINETFGDVFGKPSSSLLIAVDASLGQVEFKTDNKGSYTVGVDLNSLAKLNVAGVSAFYYVGEGDGVNAPTLKQAESPRLRFLPLPQ
jgi:hypothetical protein